jgi:hypothetical protein
VTYVVTAPYVTIKVTDDINGVVRREFYTGGVVPSSADADNVARLLRKGMLAEVAAEPVPAPATEPPAEPPAEPGDRPKDYASKLEWVDYAVSKRADGVSEDDARAAAEAKSKADLIAEFGG